MSVCVYECDAAAQLSHSKQDTKFDANSFQQFLDSLRYKKKYIYTKTRTQLSSPQTPHKVDLMPPAQIKMTSFAHLSFASSARVISIADEGKPPKERMHGWRGYCFDLCYILFPLACFAFFDCHNHFHPASIVYFQPRA